MMLGGMTFLSPWLLAALLAVPLLWWLMRVTPPPPKTVSLPTFFLLKDIQAEVKTAARTPWWLLLLRSLIMIFFILALADPVMRLSAGLPGRGGSVLLAIDNGWAAAANWSDRQARIAEFLERIGRDGRSVLMLPTAPSPDGLQARPFGPMDATDAAKMLEQLRPRPWPADHAAAAAAARQAVVDNKISYSIFFSEGISESQSATESLIQAMQGSGLMVVRDDRVNDPYILRSAAPAPGKLVFEVERLQAGRAASLFLAAYGAGNEILDRIPVELKASEKTAKIAWEVPEGMHNKISRVALTRPQMASTAYLTDSRWQQHPAGIVADSSRKENKSFLNEVYYLRRALEANGPPAVDSAEALLSRELSAIIWPDSAALTAVEHVKLLEWVQQGGFLIRFAGPNLAANPDDPLLPVPLRYGQRAMQGAMTWEKPVRLGVIPEGSPLTGFDVPQDVTVQRQILADPLPEVMEKTYLQLEDGTPLITGGPIGKGVVVLVHTTAGPDWSDFCYSGLYVEMLQRLVSLSAGVSNYKAETLLPPMMLMDAFGQLSAPSAQSAAGSIDARLAFTPSPKSPPGLYGSDRLFQVYNLGDALSAMRPLGALPHYVTEESYALSAEKSYKPDFFRLAIWLLLIDTLVTLFLRGVLTFRRAAAALAVILSLASTPVQAEEAVDPGLVSRIYLAYVETGDQDTDSVSHNGLMALKDIVNARTNIRIEGVRSVNPEKDALFYYPMLYWPMSPAQYGLSSTAARNVQNYMAQGGLILFDTRDGQFSTGGDTVAGIGTRQLRKLMQEVRIAELAPVGEDHILTKSFYLLRRFPGLHDDGALWVEKEPNPAHDSISSVVIGGNDWAAAWSAESSDRGRFQVAPGGEKQRELAYRFGVNALMMALAGSYKSDQVHISYILERLDR